MKKHKSSTPNQASASNGTAEVFVLPPDLLAKLGIKLSNIQNSEPVTPTTSIVKDTVHSVDHSIPNCLPENEDTSSIIQTANLMKESVFLSPTFFQTAPAVSDNEESSIVDKSIVKTNTAISSVSDTLLHQSNKSCVTVTEINSIGDQSAPQQLNDSVVINPTTVIPMEDVINLEEYESVKEYQVESHDGNLILTDVLYQNTENDKISNDKLNAANNTVDEHPDEAYLSDCSNSYSGCSPESVNSEVNKQNMSHKNKSKELHKVIATDTLQQKNKENMDGIFSTSDALFAPVNMNSIVTLPDSNSDVAMTEKQPVVITTAHSITEEPIIHANNSETVQNVPSENNISWIPDKQKEIELTKINISYQRASVIDEYLNNKEYNNINIVLINSESPSTENEKFALITNEQNTKEPLQENSELVSNADTQDVEKTSSNEEFMSIVEVNFIKDIQTNNDDTKTYEYAENTPNNNKTTVDENKKMKKSVTENSIDTQDRVKEIAAYLSQIAKERKNMNRNKTRNIEKETRRNSITSKLCIQGVEKPGGKLIQKDKLKCVSFSKTYQRAIIRKQIPKPIQVSDAVTTSDSFQITDNNFDAQISGTKVRALTHQNEFCICYDFGNLAYYDCEMLHEHIHFWSHKSIEYDLETLYSIYHEDYAMFKQNVDFIEDAHQIENDSNITIEDKLCWNELNTSENNEDECNLVISKSRLPAEADSSNIQKTITNAKMIPVAALKPSTLAKCTQKLTKKIINPESYSSKTEHTIKSNKDAKNISGSSTRNVPVSEVILKLSEKSVDVETEDSPKSKKKISKLENVVSSTPAETLTLENQSNNLEVERTETSRPARKSSLKAVSSATNIPATTNNRDRFKRESTASADVSLNTSHDTNEEISKTTRSHSKQNKNYLESIGRMTKHNKLTKSANTKESNKPTQAFSDKGNTLTVSKATDIRTYLKPARKASDVTTTTAPISTKVTSNTRQEATATTTKSTKRYSNTALVHRPVRQAKTIESSNVIEVVEDDLSNKYTTDKEAGCSKRIKVEKKTISIEPRAVPESAVTPSKFGIFKSTPQDKTLKITATNPALVKEWMEIAIEDTTTNYPNMNMTNEESTIPNESAMESSTFSSDTAMNHSQSTEDYTISSPVHNSDNLTKCGVCEKSVDESQWIEHISKDHDYIAWRDGDPPLLLDDEIEIKKHLQGIANQNKGLVCSKCGLIRKFAKAFLRHIKNCDGCKKEESSREPEEEYVPLLNTKTRKSREKPVAPPITCGVCNKTVEQSAWIEHIKLAHKYLAWTSEEQPLNLDDAQEVKEYLNYISKHHGGLVCSTCGVRWSYVKKYLHHISECEAGAASTINSGNKRTNTQLVLPPIVTCGVCKLDVEGNHWIKHIQVAHDYVAWIGGEQPLDPDDPEQMRDHLDSIVRAAGVLVCARCGKRCKFARGYLQHTHACAKTGFRIKVEDTAGHDATQYTCGVCRETGELTEWRSHAMSMHYNVAWKVGDIPINLKNPYAVEKFLKQYRKKHGLVCLHCKSTRNSCYGFYAHILTCGRSEEEIEAVHDVCEVCNNKYLCIYRNQHMAAHRDSDQRREKREMLARQAEEEATNPPPPEPELPSKRRAAEKAKKVIQKHSSNMVDGEPVCGCGTTFKSLEELAQHSCAQKQTRDDDDSDVSVKMENESEESGEETVDSGVSDEEDEKSEKKKKRVRIGEGSTKVQRMPYRVSNYTAYLSDAYKDFVKLHYTTERLFSEWRDSEYEIVPAEERAKYLPQITESCKVRFSNNSNDEWTTYMRFEAKKNIKGYSIFTGGATQCISWVPPHIEDESRGSYLAVSTHRGPDVPRHAPADTPRHAASVQIWDFGNFNAPPRCALCLAHEYGVVWAMDWCPSGARDGPSVIVPHEHSEPPTRLGLLALACSDGAAYVLSVRCPPPGEHMEPLMYKLKPVAELRLTMTAERQIYQATSIKWSQQKGHSIIIVGYSDGTTALYDLNTESPFLTAKEKGVTIYYPFQDRRSECSSITGVGIFATSNESYGIGGQFSSSITGGTMCGAGARPTSRAHLAASAALHAAHWPAATLAGDVPFMRSVSEMEWWGGGRRAGAARAWAACARCARAASAAPPALRAHRHHPVYPDLKKLIVAMLLMVPLGPKRKRKVNDDLSVVVEPLTYEDAAARYGLQLTFVTKSSRSEQWQAQQICNKNESGPERFPLSDIVSLAFCPSSRFHDKIALATHTGIIFITHI